MPATAGCPFTPPGAAVPFPPVMADIWSRGTRLSQKLELGVLLLFIISPPITRPTRYSLDWTWPEKEGESWGDVAASQSSRRGGATVPKQEHDTGPQTRRAD